jgi:hypothetical protein
MKLEEMLHDIKAGTPFGHCNAGINLTTYQVFCHRCANKENIFLQI